MDALNRLNLEDATLNPDELRIQLKQVGLVPVPPLSPRPMLAQDLGSVGWVARLMSALRGTHWEPVESERLEAGR